MCSTYLKLNDGQRCFTNPALCVLSVQLTGNDTKWLCQQLGLHNFFVNASKQVVKQSLLVLGILIYQNAQWKFV